MRAHLIRLAALAGAILLGVGLFADLFNRVGYTGEKSSQHLTDAVWGFYDWIHRIVGG